MITVGIIEDNQALRTGIEEFVSQNDSMRILFSCNSVEKWLMHYDHDTEGPYVLFLDIGLPGISGLKAISVIKNKYPDTKLVVITGDSSKESVWEAITSGADGYLLKPFSLKEISQQIDIIQNGHVQIQQQHCSCLLQFFQSIKCLPAIFHLHYSLVQVFQHAGQYEPVNAVIFCDQDGIIRIPFRHISNDL